MGVNLHTAGGPRAEHRGQEASLGGTLGTEHIKLNTWNGTLGTEHLERNTWNGTGIKITDVGISRDTPQLFCDLLVRHNKQRRVAMAHTMLTALKKSIECTENC